MIHLPDGQWVIGFVSYDEKGYVYKNPYWGDTWLFAKEIERQWSRALHGVNPATYRPTSKRELIMQGIEHEHDLARMLQPKVKPLHVYNLPWSGAHAGGCDIVITQHEEKDLEVDPLNIVDRSLFQVSLVGCSETLFWQPSIHNFCKTTKHPVMAWERDNEYWFIQMNPIVYNNTMLHPDGSIKKYSCGLKCLDKYKINLDEFTGKICDVMKLCTV